MPNIPRFDNEVNIRPSGAAQISPQAMGAPGAALSSAGEEFANIMSAFEQRYANARRQADAAHLTAQSSQMLGDLQFKWSQVPDRLKAQAGFDADRDKIREKLLGGIEDPQVQSHVSAQFDQEAVTRRISASNAAFQLESSARRGQLDTDLNSWANSAANADNDALRAKVMDNAAGAIRTAVDAGWLDPEVGAKREIAFKSQVQEVQVRRAMNSAIDSQSADAADALSARLSDPNEFPGLLPERREAMQTRLENLSYRLEQRAQAAIAHRDAMADRNLRRSQAQNEAALLARVNAGNDLSDSEIQRLADTQQISASGVTALHTAKRREDTGFDDPAATLRLWHAIGTKQASSAMIFDALNAGDIGRSTSVQMMRALDAGANKQQDQAARQAFSQLKTALHGGAIEQGIIPNKSPQASLWAQAQGEWSSRVTIGGENPNVVKEDMLKRYGSDTVTPTWLDQPRLGTVQSSQDLASVIQKTGQAFKAGKINQGEYTSQLQLLSKYKQFFGLQAAQRPKPNQQQQNGAKP